MEDAFSVPFILSWPNVCFTTDYQELAPDSSKKTIMMMMIKDNEKKKKNKNKKKSKSCPK